MGVFFWEYSGHSHSGLGVTEYMEYQFAKERIFWKWNTIGGCDLGTIASAHALVALAWHLEKVSRKFSTQSNSVFRDVSGHSGVPGCSVVFRCSGLPGFSTCHFKLFKTLTAASGRDSMSRGSKNGKILNFLHWFFVHFFAKCRELVKKIVYPKKKWGSLTIQAS